MEAFFEKTNLVKIEQEGIRKIVEEQEKQAVASSFGVEIRPKKRLSSMPYSGLRSAGAHKSDVSLLAEKMDEKQQSNNRVDEVTGNALD